MRIVDSHCHAALEWFEPVELLLHQMDRNKVELAALIQMNGQFDNSYQNACVRQHPDRLRSVVLVDTAREDAPALLEREVEAGATGVRFRPGTRSPGDDPLAIWRKAAELGIAVSCAGQREAIEDPAFAEVVAAVPTLPIVIEHLAELKAADYDPASSAPPKVFEIARFPNVYMKIHGLGEFAVRAIPVTSPFPFEEPIPPFLDQALDAFGAERLMWGSDYPPVSMREGYASALSFTLARFSDRTEEERALIFGGVAAKIFGFAT